MQKLKILLATVLGLAASATTLPAATLSHDGAAIGWTDSVNTNWLRLDDPLLAGLSYSDYTSGITAYGYTWTLATRDQVSSLWGEFEPGAADGGHGSLVSYSRAYGALNFLNAFGYTYRSTTAGVRFVMRGFSADDHRDTSGNLLWLYTPQVFLEAGPTGYYHEAWTVNKSGAPSERNNLTAWMIGTAVASVPLPASAAFLLSAVLAVGGLSVRNSSRSGMTTLSGRSPTA